MSKVTLRPAINGIRQCVKGHNPVRSFNKDTSFFGLRDNECGLVAVAKKKGDAVEFRNRERKAEQVLFALEGVKEVA